MNKEAAYTKLVAERKACRSCASLTNPAVVYSKKLDSEEIGPYSRWQGNLDSPVVVIAQDFADVATFAKVEGAPGERVKTNISLIELVREAGFKLSPPDKSRSDDTLFFTNAVLCLKQGQMSAAVPQKCFVECGRLFLRPTIELIRPRAVVALGGGALKAAAQAYGLDLKGRFGDFVVESPTATLPGGISLFAMYHPSPTVQNTVRSMEQQRGDWKRLGAWLALPNDSLQPAAPKRDAG